ncbi:flagellar protein FlgJ [Malonomonas rubra DSM 5091]|uniref:Flagellar protein FlgJ n=1 Tax=Malonomonas rubra DSM 5091 TaxID=1122189 RepID=A0A1M6MBC9_MALRU|nr:rod-binding protein [Malonomonas rubra]SHJ80593.1 flagellar protein FlgJ [Malonomonas rubra DSM 5091]
MDSKVDPKQLVSQALSQAPKQAKGKDPEQLRAAAEQFEAVFIQQMFKEMRNTIPDDGLIPRGNADDIYTQLQDAEAAKIMAEKGGIGLADLMMQQLLDENSGSEE